MERGWLDECHCLAYRISQFGVNTLGIADSKPANPKKSSDLVKRKRSWWVKAELVGRLPTNGEGNPTRISLATWRSARYSCVDQVRVGQR